MTLPDDLLTRSTHITSQLIRESGRRVSEIPKYPNTET